MRFRRAESLVEGGLATPQQFGTALDVIMDGRDIGDFKQEGEKKIDLVIRVANAHIDTPEDLYNALIPTPGGLGSVVLGGLAVSTVFTVFLISSLLMFFIRMEGRHRKESSSREPVIAK